MGNINDMRKSEDFEYGSLDSINSKIRPNEPDHPIECGSLGSIKSIKSDKSLLSNEGGTVGSIKSKLRPNKLDGMKMNEFRTLDRRKNKMSIKYGKY